MFFEHFLMAEANESNVYLAACAATRDALIVDAGGWLPGVAEAVCARSLAVRWICVTHGHFDHTDALDRFRAEFPDATVVRGARGVRSGAGARLLADGERLAVGSLTVEALAIPGHTADSTAYRLTRPAGAQPGRPAVDCLFSGDVLFAGSVGGCGSPGEQAREMDGIRRRILTLGEDTPIYPGHGPATTVGIEKRFNPFLR